MNIRTAFPHETAHEDVRIPMPDGVELYARIWRPLTAAPVPALLEYLPYRLTDWTAPRDGQRHPWYAGHGYASVRVDVRGHGCSGGSPGEAYADRELADGVAVVEWLAAQPWCTGSVGMFGIGWGGTNSLQIAALAPEALKAVVTVCSTDDRFDNDAHYAGGSVLAADLHAASATLLAFAARPPDPQYVGDGWREQWLGRLESVEPPLHTWLAHQTRDAHWMHGSVCEDYGAVRAAVLAVGGWHDPYRDTVLRLVSHLPADRVRGLIGPWSHQYPDRGLPPGPAIGFLQETLRWWDHWLRGSANGVMDEPLLRSWISASHPPATTYELLPGRWAGDPAWPSPAVTPVTYGLQGAPVAVASPQHTGLDAGRFRPYGNEADLPPDQREEDAKSACFEFPVAGGTPLEILGRPRVTLRLRMDVPYGQVAARLCDVAPDGSSTLVTRGALNLSARLGRDQAAPWPVGAYEDVVVELNGIGHAFAPGHRIRLALSSAYWPWLWPRPGSEAGWTLDPAGSALVLPVRFPSPATDGAVAFGPPEQAPPLGVAVPATLDEPRPERMVVRDVARGAWRLEVDPRYGGTRVYPDGLESTEEAGEVYEIRDGDALSARTRSTWRIRLHRPEPLWDVRIETRSEIGCDGAAFLTSDELVCREGEEVVFHRTWERRLPRTAG
ncbi:CocE/NonD family hydrolase [Streptomyces sp. BR123]|uniref:CocE/NonD family hydrolase n=1 Tax=Streptomyces sp. BR123 TaxID=2749828 RepID=UPI0015C4AF8B|nr:CocE/NonD family hydrolase [Streptomyces sp. BR123]NXY95281.1 CocE/NonD family hydrolase [Streptomyces sp. BR123]